MSANMMSRDSINAKEAQYNGAILSIRIRHRVRFNASRRRAEMEGSQRVSGFQQRNVFSLAR